MVVHAGDRADCRRRAGIGAQQVGQSHMEGQTVRHPGFTLRHISELRELSQNGASNDRQQMGPRLLDGARQRVPSVRPQGRGEGADEEGGG